MLRRLERFGRFELDPQGSGLGSDASTDCILPFTDYIHADRAEQETLLRELYALIGEDQGGFATYGAARLAWELFDETALQLPSGLPLIDAGIRFKLARGLPPATILTGYELKRFWEWADRPPSSAG